jgi:hypothetical protein
MSDAAGKLIMELHVCPDAPGSPMTMISRAEFEYLKRMEAEAIRLLALVCKNREDSKEQ